MGIQVLEGYDPLDEPDKNILTLHISMFNTCFIQVFEFFNQLNNIIESNTKWPTIPGVSEVLNNIGALKESVKEPWHNVRRARNNMVHVYPYKSRFWKWAWKPLKYGIMPIGSGVERQLGVVQEIIAKLNVC
jgi:hypothetical protein